VRASPTTRTFLFFRSSMSASLVSVHPETPPCHSEPFDLLRINSAKNLCGGCTYEILRRPPSAGLLRMTPINAVSGWKLINRFDSGRFMSETIIVFIIAGIALALSVRWFYRTVAGKSEGCGCGENSCPSISSCDTSNSSDCCEKI